MAKGGRREGAGRKKSALTTKTREIAERAIQEGKTPLEIMLDNARSFYQQALDAEKVLAEIRPENIAGLEPKAQFDYILAEVKKVAGLRQLAGEAAKDAARYIHPPIGAVAPGAGVKDDHVPVAERLKHYARKEAIEASAGKVVDLKKAKRGK